MATPSIALDRFGPRTDPATTLARLSDRVRAGWSDAWWIVLIAAALSIGFYVWYDAHGLTLAFNDARTRELIARRVLFARTPGLAQLGTVSLAGGWVVERVTVE